jgi:predicted nucleic acid-binding protein
VVIVADTSPLNYLIQIDCDYLLPLIYRGVAVPTAVIAELSHASAPTKVRDWLSVVPAWLLIRSLDVPPDVGLDFLDPGEREAIQLAEATDADLLLIDERKGRLEAKRRGLRTTGTLGVLLSAGELGLIEPKQAYRRLVAETTFRTSATLEARFFG